MSLNKPKFKKGDRVVIVRTIDTDDRRWRIGKTATVLDDSRIPGLAIEGGQFGAEKEDYLELYLVYHSPLYKALK